MTDDQQWQAPGQPAASPVPSAPMPSAPMAPPPPPPPLGRATWTPPPKPGLIPLRPITFGTILGAAFQTLRRNPAATLVPALILTTILGVIRVLSSTVLLPGYWDTFGDSYSGTALGFDPGSLLLSTLLPWMLSLIVTAIVQGVVTLQVASSALGARLRLSGLWRRLRGRRGAVIGWAALTGAAALIGVGIPVLGIVGIGLTGPAGVAIALLLGFLLGLGLVVVFCWLWVKLGFVPAAIVLERASVLTAMRRSWRLTVGGFWRIFGTRLLVAAMFGIATTIVTSLVSLVFLVGGGLLQPTGSSESALTGTLLASAIVSEAVTAVVSAVGLVVSTATTALLYLDQRMRHEGLDLDLTRFVDRRAAGEQGLTDPYLPKLVT